MQQFHEIFEISFKCYNLLNKFQNSKFNDNKSNVNFKNLFNLSKILHEKLSGRWDAAKNYYGEKLQRELKWQKCIVHTLSDRLNNITNFLRHFRWFYYKHLLAWFCPETNFNFETGKENSKIGKLIISNIFRIFLTKFLRFWESSINGLWSVTWWTVNYLTVSKFQHCSSQIWSRRL